MPGWAWFLAGVLTTVAVGTLAVTAYLGRSPRD